MKLGRKLKAQDNIKHKFLLKMLSISALKPELAVSNDKFTQKLYSKMLQSSSKESNLIFAPFSLNTVLTMTLLGAKGVTKEELRLALALINNDTDVIKGIFRGKLFLNGNLYFV